jgi:hypothetical protein
VSNELFLHLKNGNCSDDEVIGAIHDAFRSNVCWVLECSIEIRAIIGGCIAGMSNTDVVLATFRISWLFPRLNKPNMSLRCQCPGSTH